MNKGELVEKVAKECVLSKSAAEQVLASVFGAITDAMATGEKVALLGFGTFSVSERAAREGRNPQTGEPIQVAASRAPKVSIGSTFKKAVKAVK